MILNPAQRPAWSRYVIAVLAVASAAVGRAWLLGTLGTRAPYLTFYPAVILAALCGGLPAGLLATALSALTASFFWIEPVGRFGIRDSADGLSLGVFVMSCAATSIVTRAMQQAEARASSAEAEVQLARERGRADEELRRYRLLAEHSRDVILYMQRVDGRILEANAAAEKAYGYSRGEFQSLSIQQLRADDGRGLTGEQLAGADKGGILFETIHRRKDGSTFPVEVSSQGATIGGTRMLISVIRDITDRKQAEEELRSQREWLRVTLTSIGDAVLATGPDERLTFLNPVAAQLTGWSEKVALGKPVGEVFRTMSEETRQPGEDIAGRALRERVVVSLADQTVLLTPDGREVPIEDSAAPIRDAAGTVAGVVVVFREVTERRHAQEALRASEARYRRLVDLAPGALLVQQDGLIVYCNEAAARLYGVESPAGLVGTGMFDRVHRDDLPMVLERIRDAQNGARLPVREARHLRLDGSEVAVETTAGPLDWRGRPAMLVFVNDITERKRAETRLRESQKLESLGLLAGGVAHDFNNLLVGVIGNASLARDMISPDHPAAELLVGVLTAGEQAAHLTRQMLAYSGKGKFVIERLDLSALLRGISSLFRPSISKKIAVRLDLEPELPAIEADRGQIQQVFMNLALNAAEAIGAQEGLITVTTGVHEVDERYTQMHPETPVLAAGEYVYLEVRDTGCGMDEATRGKIFDPFFSTKFVGRGLGLAAVAGIVRGHNGAIMVASEPGQGSCFTVMLPAAAGAAGESPAAGRSTGFPGTGTVLVVDDEPTVRKMLKNSLERQGYQVLLADGALAAMDVLKRHPGEVALVILDLNMPHMSGQEALPELRKIRPGVKVVVSSGYSEQESMRLFEGQRVTGFIQKPYTSKGIAEMLKACIGCIG